VWGKQIQGLVDLRLLHKVETLSTKRGGQTYAGRKFTAFTLDLAAWTSTWSERIVPMDFWKTSEKQKMRQVKLIYTPELATEAKARGKDLKGTVLGCVCPPSGRARLALAVGWT
jgi:beta-galactosidase GanA